jgi:hypothetical protein
MKKAEGSADVTTLDINALLQANSDKMVDPSSLAAQVMP